MDSTQQTHNLNSSENPGDEKSLSEWEHAMIDLFVHAAQLIGIPKSMGQIYGLLFCSDRALAMDDIISKLAISKGSTSQGLKTLRQIGAVKTVFQVGDRRDHYEVEMKLRRLVSGFLGEQVRPHLASGNDRLDHIHELAQLCNKEEQERAMERLKTLRSWHDKTSKIIPVVQKVL
ncbi:hypothetical protein [Rubellicoccus peritrichatus]|uniref:HTH-type transcriptional regulator n=1 Tax=Rubellicoccus peritrichatus TaxID=3080537 RepID=A0AAQ3LBW0_9BACT|nr:hypothetical protein [Puniceicoccus sp. CR14]WOO42906.1 hypothetical protein RZN69_07360 [Puniceicoccus sp. CR14]